MTAALDQFFESGGGARYQILARGGTGTQGNGGEGGYFDLYAYAAGNINILQNGTINTNVSIPAATPSLGSNPRTIASDTTLTPPDSSGRILGDDGLTTATGLRVLAGATLTLRPNFNFFESGDTGTFDEVFLLFEDGVLIEGTIRVALRDSAAANDGLGPNTADLRIEANNIVTGTSSVIDAAGRSAGADGGDVDFQGDGTVILRGRITTAGSNGVRGGSGGGVFVYSWSFGVYNTGPITTSGGTGSSDVGGDAGDIELFATESTEGSYYGGPVVNRNTLTARGGDGQSGGGNGGDVDIESENLGALVNSGDIDTSGGNATGSVMLAGELLRSNGGDAGSIYMYAGAGALRVTGNLRSMGGNAVDGDGGDGDYIELYNNDEDYIEEEYAIGGFFVGADMNASGGNGYNGGSAGDIEFYPDQDEVVVPGDQPTYLAGYSLIDCSGGNGSVNGGSAYDGTCEIYQDGAEDYEGTSYIYDIIIRVPMRFNGGNGTTGSGGNGADLDIYQDYDYTPPFIRMVRNLATIELKGGSGGASGGNGGDLYMYDHYRCSNESNIDTSGGAGTSGGNGGDIEILSDDICNNNASLTANGGSGGGNGGDIDVAGNETTFNGTVNSRGGSGGGNGGDVNILSTQHATPATGTANVAGGIGGGNDGEVRLDGIRAALSGGAMTFPG